MVKVYFDSEFGWTDWFVTAEGVPQGGRGRLETDGESVTISAADGNGGLRTITYAWDAAMPNEPKGTVEDRKQFVGGFRLAAYDGARVDTDGVIHFAEGDAKVELLNDMRYLAYGNLPKRGRKRWKTAMCRRDSAFSARAGTRFSGRSCRFRRITAARSIWDPAGITRGRETARRRSARTAGCRCSANTTAGC